MCNRPHFIRPHLQLFPVDVRAGTGRFALRLYAVSIGACVDPTLVVDTAKIDDGDDFTACGSLETNGTVQVSGERNVKFVAGDRIVLNNGFQVNIGTVFSAVIDPALPIYTLVIEDFETGVPANWLVYGDYFQGVTIDSTISTIGDTDPLALPEQVGDNEILSIVATYPPGAVLAQDSIPFRTGATGKALVSGSMVKIPAPRTNLRSKLRLVMTGVPHLPMTLQDGDESNCHSLRLVPVAPGICHK